MNKKYLILIFLILGLVPILFYIFKIDSRDDIASPSPSAISVITKSPTINLPIISSVVSPKESNTISIPVEDDFVNIFDFRSSVKYTSTDKKSLFLEKSPDFDIFYYTEDNSFTIDIRNNPISLVRDRAESKLLADLKISKNDACKLSVIVAVSRGVNDDYSGQDLGLSFCPGAVIINE